MKEHSPYKSQRYHRKLHQSHKKSQKYNVMQKNIRLTIRDKKTEKLYFNIKLQQSKETELVHMQCVYVCMCMDKT